MAETCRSLCLVCKARPARAQNSGCPRLAKSRTQFWDGTLPKVYFVRRAFRWRPTTWRPRILGQDCRKQSNPLCTEVWVKMLTMFVFQVRCLQIPGLVGLRVIQSPGGQSLIWWDLLQVEGPRWTWDLTDLHAFAEQAPKKKNKKITLFYYFFIIFLIL